MSHHVRSKALITNPFRRGHRRVPIVALAAAALVVLAASDPTRISTAIGLPLILLGVGIRLWGAGHLTKTRELTLSGPYRYVRNPLYLGTLLIGVGFAVLAGPYVAAVALPIWLGLFFGHYFPRKERTETARLAALYGERYQAYLAAVPALVPSLRAWSASDPAPGISWRFEQVRSNSELGPPLTVALALALVFIGTL